MQSTGEAIVGIRGRNRIGPVALALALFAACGRGATQPSPSPAPSFSCTFALAVSDCGFQEEAKAAGRASISTIARDGGTSVRLHTRPGDNDVTASGSMERNDLRLTQEATDGYEGREQWWAHSIYFPDDFQAPRWHNYVVFDFHNTASGPWQANFMVLFMRQARDSVPGLLGFVGFGGQNNAEGRYMATIGPVEKNRWYDFVYHVRWSSGPDGFFDAWVDGEKKLEHRGPTLYAGQGVYLKLANYHVPVCDPYPKCIGTHAPSSVIHDRVIRGTSPLAVARGPLEGVLGLVDGVLRPESLPPPPAGAAP